MAAPTTVETAEKIINDQSLAEDVSIGHFSDQNGLSYILKNESVIFSIR